VLVSSYHGLIHDATILIIPILLLQRKMWVRAKVLEGDAALRSGIRISSVAVSSDAPVLSSGFANFGFPPPSAAKSENETLKK
jgi:hypothetical protein